MIKLKEVERVWVHFFKVSDDSEISTEREANKFVHLHLSAAVLEPKLDLARLKAKFLA